MVLVCRPPRDARRRARPCCHRIEVSGVQSPITRIWTPWNVMKGSPSGARGLGRFAIASHLEEMGGHGQRMLIARRCR